MTTKVILDGSLFSECEMIGSNRFGMHRVAEEITKFLVASNELEIGFANTTYSDLHHELLNKFVAANYPAHNAKIQSKKPALTSNIPKLRGLLIYLANRFALQVGIQDLEQYNVFHSFYYPFPPNVESRKIKKSITFLDIIALRLNGYPEDLIHRTKQVVNSIVPNFAVSISEFSKQDLLDYDARIDSDRVFVVPLAASPELFFQNTSRDEWRRVKDKYKLPDNYFLSVSSTDHRKNLPHLIKSFSKFVLQENPADLFLVLTGNSVYSRSILDELEISQTVKDRICITEKFIENEDLAALYSNALCFFFMSYYEGFGLPVLEAMQCGVPVVTSNASSLPEIVGNENAGIMLPPHDEDALCDAMNKIYSSDELRGEYSKSGLERSAQFSWQRCADEYARIFKSIASDF